MTREIALLVLGLNQRYSKDELKLRYRDLAKISHPDSKGDESLFKLINDSYNYLNSEKTFNTSRNTHANNKDCYQNSSKNSKVLKYITLKELYDNHYYEWRNNIDLIMCMTKITVKPIFSRNWKQYDIMLDCNFSCFKLNNSVIFDKSIFLPDFKNILGLFKINVIFMGKTYSNYIFSFKKGQSSLINIKFFEKYVTRFATYLRLTLIKI